jgi:hypothetical protein
MKHMCAGKAENNSQKHPSSALQLFTPTYEVYFALAKSIVNMAHVLLTVMLVWQPLEYWRWKVQWQQAEETAHLSHGAALESHSS